MHRLWIDTETTGLNPDKHQILTGYLIFEDDRDNILSEYGFTIPSYKEKISFGAMNVNKIAFETIVAKSWEDERGADRTIKELATHISENLGKERFSPAGQNVQFDMGFIVKMFEEAGIEGFSDTLDHHYTDTANNATLFRDAGLYPKDLKLNLSQLAQFHGIKNPAPHTAKGDCHTARLVYHAQRNLLTSLAPMLVE